MEKQTAGVQNPSEEKGENALENSASLGKKPFKQTAGRDAINDFAPKFAELNDDVLFGEIWAREDLLSPKLRSVVTVSALIGKGIVDSSLKYHIETAKKHGVTKTEMAEMLTHIAFYAGWPNAWAAFRMAKEVYADECEEEFERSPQNKVGSLEAGGVKNSSATSGKGVHDPGSIFGRGEPNVAYSQYFTGQSYLKSLTDGTKTVYIANVTFEPACRNNWHIHHAKSGGGQILICVDGTGYYQEWGKEARLLKAGDVVTIPAGVKHWHGATKDSWFSHLAVECPGEDCFNEWLEVVDDEQYNSIK